MAGWDLDTGIGEAQCAAPFSCQVGMVPGWGGRRRDHGLLSWEKTEETRVWASEWLARDSRGLMAISLTYRAHGDTLADVLVRPGV